MTTYAEIIKAAIPTANEDMCEYILWNRTPYPMAKVSARMLFKAASRTARAYRNGFRLCELCDNLADADGFECRSCRESLEEVRGAA